MLSMQHMNTPLQFVIQTQLLNYFNEFKFRNVCKWLGVKAEINITGVIGAAI